MSATLVLRTVKGSPLTNYEVDNNFSNLNVWANTVDSNVGVLSSLTTTEKSNIVFAVNEVRTFASNASNLTTGTVPDARITGSYTGLSSLTGSGTATFAKFLGNASDTNTAPSFSWSGDTNTGMYRIAGDQIGFTTNGVTRLTITNTDLISTGIVSAVDFNSTSDVALKENIQSIQNPLDILSNLDGKEFTWKNTGNKAYGLIAQDVEKVLPSIVSEINGVKGINYINIIAYLIEAVKQLSNEITQLKQK